MDAAGSGFSACAPAPNSTELMIALSQIQQLIPLVDYRPGGLTHLVLSLVLPLLPGEDGAESMQRYRGNVEHAFRVAGQLATRVQDMASVGSALELAQRLMKERDETTRILRVRKKRRLFVEQQKLLEANNWGPPAPMPVRSNVTSAAAEETTKRQEVKMTAFLTSQNPPNVELTQAQREVPPPKSAGDVQMYLAALHTYLKTAAEAGLMPQGVGLRQIKARVANFSKTGFSLELQVAPVIKAFIEATPTYETATDHVEASSDLINVELARLTVGALTEAIVSFFTWGNHSRKKQHRRG